MVALLHSLQKSIGIYADGHRQFGRILHQWQTDKQLNRPYSSLVSEASFFPLSFNNIVC